MSVSPGVGARLARLASLLVGLALMLSPVGVHAQDEWDGLAGGSLLVGFPVGEFENFVGPSPGLSLYLLGPGGILGLRLEGSLVYYGSETRRRPLSQTVQLVEVDVTTQNFIISLLIGPQLTAQGGILRPYLNAGVGASYFATTSSVSGSSDIGDFASSTNFDDFTFAYATSGGVLYPPGAKRLP